MVSHHKMRLLEEYQELIERDSEEISILWKIIQMFLYLCSAVSGYTCAIIFYVIWEDISGGRCIFWAKLELIHPIIYPEKDYSQQRNETSDLGTSLEYLDWRKDVIIVLDNTIYCNIYYKISFCSCIFGITGLTLFTICGRGGYGSKIFTSPWRIVIPGFFLNLIFMALTMFLTHYIEYGFFTFTSDLCDLAMQKSRCDVIQYYLEPYNKHKYNICYFYLVLRVSSWIMTWSWTAGFILLVVRIINVTDFRLLRVKIYKAPLNNVISKDVTKRVREDNVEELHPAKRKKLNRILCCTTKNKDD